MWGAGGGIGRALVERLAQEGHPVLAVARDASALAGLPAEVAGADLARESEVAACALWAAQLAPSVSLWAWAAGDILAQPLLDTPVDALRRLLDNNLLGLHAALRHTAPLLAPDAHVVVAGVYPERLRAPRLGAYAAAKAAVEAYVEVLGKELRGRRVTYLRLPAVDTGLWRKTPFPVPKGALAPAAVADAVLRAHREGHQGVLAL